MQNDDNPFPPNRKELKGILKGNQLFASDWFFGGHQFRGDCAQLQECLVHNTPFQVLKARKDATIESLRRTKGVSHVILKVRLCAKRGQRLTATFSTPQQNPSQLQSNEQEGIWATIVNKELLKWIVKFGLDLSHHIHGGFDGQHCEERSANGCAYGCQPMG